MNGIYLALGSNLGDRAAYLDAGVRGLAIRDIQIIRRAAVYSTEPLEVVDQPWFLNTVLEVSTDLDPKSLLRACLEVEKENGRLRENEKGPRTLDIDIILYGNAIVREPGLTIPHASFASRRFVLIPLAEIAPQRVDPASGLTVLRLLENCRDLSSVTLVR